MKKIYLLACVIALSGCATTTWTSKKSIDEFTDTGSCKIIYGSDFDKGFNKGLGGIHYYPFIEKVNGEIIFGVQGDYKIPVGDVQIRIDKNQAITISYTETPVFYSASTTQPVDLSYMKNIEGIDQKAMQASMDAAMKNVQKISSPFTATDGKKAKLIIEQMKNGTELKMRVIGFGTNSVQSSSGKYKIDHQLITALNECGI